MKNIAVAPVILEDGRLSFCVPGMMVSVVRGVEPDWKDCFGRDDYIYESISHLVGWCFFVKWRWRNDV